jgi:magnesium-transporting ATPase (P-type)
MKVLNETSQEVEEYEILKEFPFDSDRKRMTLIVKHRGKYLLMCKGADSIMLKRVNKDRH